MPYKPQSSSGENLPKWDWDSNPELECSLIKTRPGTGKAEGYTFHEVEEYSTKEKYSLLGNTVLDRIFEEAGIGQRIKIVFEGMKKGKNKKKYKSFAWEKWEDE